MSRHHLSNASELFIGRAQHNAAHGSKTGVPLAILTLIALGAPAAADGDGLINDATSTELPNAGTVSYTFPAANVSPTDEVLRTGVLDVPRNVVAVVTHASSVVAMTIRVTGTDYLGMTMVEDLAISATGTSKTANGKKAFKTITKIDLIAAGDASANTVNVGTGSVLGLPYRVLANRIFSPRTAGAADTGTFVAADDTTPTATTGDTRGTYTPSGTLNGSNDVALLAIVDPSSRESAYGKTPFAG